MTADPARVQTREQFAEHLAELFHQRGWSYQRVAEEAGLSPATVLGIVKGTTFPRPDTLVAFVEAFGRDAQPWLAARARIVRSDVARPGTVISELDEEDALRLEVHRAATEPDEADSLPVLPVYLRRPRLDDRLRAEVAAARRSSRLVMVIGDSSTGKTRACWEAIRAELPEWRVWHPLTPDRPMAVVEAVRDGLIAPRTVLWLNEAQFYLDAGADGERVAATLQELLADRRRGPLLILGSMWPEFWQVLTASPARDDPHRAARSLLDQAKSISAPRSFDPEQLEDLAELIESDPRLRSAVRTAGGGRITQFLAGAPDLLRRYEHAGAAAKAVLRVAMDARRLGHGLYLPEPLLAGAAEGYIDAEDWDQLGDDWFAEALEELTAFHRRLPGPLIRHRPRSEDAPSPYPLYRLADYLEQQGRARRRFICPPITFWKAAARYARAPADLAQLSESARARGRFRYALELSGHAGASTAELFRTLAEIRVDTGDIVGAEEAACRAASNGELTALRTVSARLAEAGHLPSAERLAWKASRRGDVEAVRYLIAHRDRNLDHEGAMDLAQRAAESGDIGALRELAWLREQSRDWTSAELLYEQAAAAGDDQAFQDLMGLREDSLISDSEEESVPDHEISRRIDARTEADWEAAISEEFGDPSLAWLRPEELDDVHQAIRGDPRALRELALAREQAGDRTGAEAAARYSLPFDAGAILELARVRDENGQPGSAWDLAQEAFARCNAFDQAALDRITHDGVWDSEDAERLCRQAMAVGGHYALREMASLLGFKAGEIAVRLLLEAANSGDSSAFLELARLHIRSGDKAGAERLYRYAIALGDEHALTKLAELFAANGNKHGAWRLRRFGMTADGKAEDPWEPAAGDGRGLPAGQRRKPS